VIVIEEALISDAREVAVVQETNFLEVFRLGD
jgi:hypothetical protein